MTRRQQPGPDPLGLFLLVIILAIMAYFGWVVLGSDAGWGPIGGNA